jgi:hypothetical protein
MAKPNVFDGMEMIAGTSWSKLLRYLTAPDVNGVQTSAIPANWTCKAQFRAHQNAAAVLIEIEPDPDSLTGEILLELTPAQTRTLPSVGFYAVEIYGPDPLLDAVEVVRGRFSVELEGVTT